MNYLAPLHLIAEKSSIAHAWVEGLDRIREKVSGMTSAQRHTWWLWDKFKSADKDGNGQIFMDYLLCDGSEQSIFDCPSREASHYKNYKNYNNNYINYCYNYKNVFILCD